MEKEQLQHLESRLLKERERAVRALEKFDEHKLTGIDDGTLTLYPLHMADEGTDTQEQEKQFLMASQEGRLLYSIDEALRTLYKTPEKYGVCDSCGQNIASERLDIVPWARLCVDCQRTQEEASPTAGGVEAA